MKLEDFLSSDAYTPVNKALARHLGFVCAGFLGELIRQRVRFGSSEFYFSQEDMEKEIGISAKVQRSCIGILVEKGYLSVDKRGAPCRNWYTINDCAILNCYSFNESGGQTRCAQTAQLDVPKGNNLMCPNGTTYNNKETNKENKKESELSLSEQETQDNIKEKKEKVAAKERKEKSEGEYSEEFEKFWKLYPAPSGRGSKKDSRKKWNSWSDEDIEKIKMKILEEHIYVESGKKEKKRVCALEKFLENNRGIDFDLESFVIELMENKKDKDNIGIKLAKEYLGEENVRRFVKKYIMTHDSMVLDLH